MKLLFFYVIIVNTQTLQKQWIDPHGMNSKNIEKLQIKDFIYDGSKNVIDGSKINECNCKIQSTLIKENITFKYLKRIVNLILKSARVDNHDIRILKGNFFLNTEDDNYKFLNKFPTYEEVDIEKLRHLDSILTNIFERTVTDEAFDFLLTTREKFLNVLFSLETLIVFGIFIALYIAYRLLQSQFSFFYVFKYFIIIIFITDYGFRYKHLLEEAEKENIKISLNESCKEIGWWKYLFSYKMNCEKKVVTPLEVALFQLKQIIIIPLSSIGTGMGTLAQELWSYLPFPWNILIFPVMLLFIILLIAIIMTILNGSSFRINLMHLFHLEFGEKMKNTTDGLNIFLDQIHRRPMIQSGRKSSEKKIRLQMKNRKNLSKIDKNDVSKRYNINNSKQLTTVKQNISNNSDKNTESKKTDVTK